MKLKSKNSITFDSRDLEKLVEDVYGLDIDIIEDMITYERIGQHTYHEFDVDGEQELDSIGDDEIVKVWSETGQLKEIDMRNDPQWAPAWDEYYYGNVEVKHILHRLFKDGHIVAGHYVMLIWW
jgi:hypothetical protein